MNIVLLCALMVMPELSICAMEFSMSPTCTAEKILINEQLNQSLSPTFSAETNNGSDLLDKSRSPIFKLGTPPKTLSLKKSSENLSAKPVVQPPREIVENDKRYYPNNVSVACLEQAIKKETNRKKLAEAHLLLGMHHAESAGGLRSGALAQYHYHHAEDSTNLSIALAAKLLLCDLVYQKKAVLAWHEYSMKNQIALNYCNEIIERGKSYRDYIVNARFRRGIICGEDAYELIRQLDQPKKSNGCYDDRIIKKLAQAQEDFNYVLNQQHNLDAAKEAKHQLDRFDLHVINLIQLDD